MAKDAIRARVDKMIEKVLLMILLIKIVERKMGR